MAHSAVETYAALAAHRGKLDRASRSAQVADIIRDGILDGTFRPGARLSEPDICAALTVSRNTLREAFRTLIEERLVVHELNRGVFVRVPAVEDIAEVYRCRRIVECTALREHPRTGTDLAPVAAALERADRCAAQDDWTGVGTADVDFHRAVTALNGSRLLDALMSGVWNELRLIFHVVAEPETFHRPYLHRNHDVFDALTGGRAETAATLLADYLADAEAQLRAAYAEIARPGRTSAHG
ncbi:GntR family transcriptional regulator [Nocardia sp. CDC159]|uniref:GntR family transcriptional regulator n=1 Tax=Nocardia pulmonis TaxID=2951408 RepID=A0A9X2E7F2_9NOCA|nr:MULTISPECIES: GntR family transcriptional regulator [Nocardia]MCM6775502.1 GntR family transcriptional regulator [Nocardia pulmonis]MCM6787764.1 GntR family transcriptional regulator [Nocardia sp. CDC159]